MPKKEQAVTQKDIEHVYQAQTSDSDRHTSNVWKTRDSLRSAVNPYDKRCRNIILTEKAIVLKKDLDDNKEIVDDETDRRDVG